MSVNVSVSFGAIRTIQIVSVHQQVIVVAKHYVCVVSNDCDRLKSKELLVTWQKIISKRN